MYSCNNVRRNVGETVGEKGGNKCAEALEVTLGLESELSNKMWSLDLIT